jgi:hypothetical protein
MSEELVDITERMEKLMETWSPNGGLLGLDWGIHYHIDHPMSDGVDENIYYFEFYVLYDKNPFIDDDRILSALKAYLEQQFKDDLTVKVQVHEFGGDTVEIWRDVDNSKVQSWAS